MKTCPDCWNQYDTCGTCRGTGQVADDFVMPESPHVIERIVHVKVPTPTTRGWRIRRALANCAGFALAAGGLADFGFPHLAIACAALALVALGATMLSYLPSNERD